MPTLNWIGKEAVVKHHKEVPFHLLEPVPELSLSSPASGRGAGGEGNSSGNLIVQGDNLHALKALLPRYAGQVKCIYIDPPYNTGNEGWVYNDNVNSPEIRRWLGEVVGKEGETLDRHDRWLSMMYPRLVLLRQFLRDDGAIFVSIDDNEVATLRLLMDEIFEARNFVGTVIWQKKYAVSNDHKTIAPMHDFVLVYQRSPSWQRNLLPCGEEKDSQYKHEDDRGQFRNSDYTCAKTAEERPNLYGRIGDFDSKEEFECACWLDIQAQQGRIQFWVRNLVRREDSSFFLQKADGRFYPDFLCQLPGAKGQPGAILTVEYKGADRWNGAEDDRLIGGLWANLSEGRCRFVMVKDKRWDWIEPLLT